MSLILNADKAQYLFHVNFWLLLLYKKFRYLAKTGHGNQHCLQSGQYIWQSHISYHPYRGKDWCYDVLTGFGFGGQSLTSYITLGIGKTVGLVFSNSTCTGRDEFATLALSCSSFQQKSVERPRPCHGYHRLSHHSHAVLEVEGCCTTVTNTNTNIE